MKIWTSNKKNDDKIIVFLNDTIYKANPPSDKIENCVAELKMQNLPSKYFFGVPVRYISEINMQEGKKYIEILFKADTEHLKIEDDDTRKAVFEYFKESIPGAAFSIIKPSKMHLARKPFIAMCVIGAIFLWCLYIANGMESGTEYEVKGSANSLATVVLAISAMGVKNVILVFGSLFLIACISFVRKYQTPVVKNTLLIQRTQQ